MRFHARFITAACAVGALLGLLPRAAGAQESRADAIAAQQAEKAMHLAPRVPTRAEQMLLRVRSGLLEQPRGFHPNFGSVYDGGGFAAGAGYRQFLGDRTTWHLSGLYSIKNYKLVDVSFISPGHAAGRLDARASAGWRDATQVPFHGLGIDSPRDQSAYRMQQTYAGGGLALRPVRNVLIAAGATYEDYALKSPGGGRTSVEDVHTAGSAPGLGEELTYVHTTISTGYDWRPAAGYARSGGLYEVAHHRYFDRDGTYSFDRVDTDLVQHLPILRENWVVSLHGRLQTTLGDDDLVPYFLLPSLGSGSTLRGYSSWRFRDRHSLLLSAEWRWIPSRQGFDMALFYDAGTVANRLDAIALDDLVDDFGIGARFHTPVGTPVRIELAKGGEGVRLVLAASAAF
jgi:outer membrane protein assembly factor BamA